MVFLYIYIYTHIDVHIGILMSFPNPKLDWPHPFAIGPGTGRIPGPRDCADEFVIGSAEHVPRYHR